MKQPILNLPTDLLRTFVTVVDLESFTRAANVLGRTQPAISLQMSKLQNLVGKRLFEQNKGKPRLTEDGSVLATHARQILHLNDFAVARFIPPEKAGILRVGLPTDFAVSKLQASVAAFIEANSNVHLEIVCGLSQDLLRMLHEGQLDLAICLTSSKNQQYLVRSWEDQPIWAISAAFQLPKDAMVPIVCHPKGCEYRKRMAEALSHSGRDWRVVYTSPDISGISSAVKEGIGVTALTNATLDKDMRVLGASEGFPTLRKIQIGLFYKLPNLPPAGLELSSKLIECLDVQADHPIDE